MTLVTRINELERRLDALQETQSRAPEPQALAPAGAARYEVAISELREQMRRLSGQLEEYEYQIRRQTESMERFQQDVDLRLQALEERGINGGNGGQMSAPVIGDEEADMPSPPPLQVTSGSAMDEYQQAFDMLNRGNYADAERLFSRFITQYPNDKLIGNAHYWLGEVYYVQGQHEVAAEQFRKGFQTAPDGAKAPDNLLRLGMTLGVLERRKEACIVLKQLRDKYANRAKNVQRKATKESVKLGCN